MPQDDSDASFQPTPHSPGSELEWLGSLLESPNVAYRSSTDNAERVPQTLPHYGCQPVIRGNWRERKHLLAGDPAMSDDVAGHVAAVMRSYSSRKPDVTAKALRKYWLGFSPNKGIQLIRAAQREQLEMAGTPVPILKAIGNEIAKAARTNVLEYVPLAQLLWDEFGREGRLVALIVFGAMELVEPKRIVPLLRILCRQCVSWEDADRLAMDAVEPIVRKQPERWLPEMAAWLKDESRWVRRAAITTIGRLPMKHPECVGQCLALTEQLLADRDSDVKRATSFAIRTCARVDPKRACTFLKEQVPAADPEAIWVLCDSIKSMDRRIIGHFATLLPRYKKWSAAPEIGSKERRSIESAMKVLQAS